RPCPPGTPPTATTFPQGAARFPRGRVARSLVVPVAPAGYPGVCRGAPAASGPATELAFLLSPRRPVVRNSSVGDDHDHTRDRRGRPGAAGDGGGPPGPGRAVRPLPRPPAQDGPPSPRPPPVRAPRHVGRPPGRLPRRRPAVPRVRACPGRAVLHLAALADG